MSAVDAGGTGDAALATVTVHVTIAFHQRRGRKVIIAPDGAGQDTLRAPQPPTRTRHEVTPAVRALARAFRCRRLLDAGSATTVHEIAAAENINPSYVSRVLRLTLLAPEIVEAILAGVGGVDGLPLERLMRPFATDWGEQRWVGDLVLLSRQRQQA